MKVARNIWKDTVTIVIRVDYKKPMWLNGNVVISKHSITIEKMIDNSREGSNMVLC